MVNRKKSRQLATKISLFVGLISGSSLYSQIAPSKYFVPFSNKKNTQYSTQRPLEFLSKAAVLRRLQHGIAITAQDFPVNAEYIQEVKAQGNVKVLYSLKWFNGVVIETEDSIAIDKIEQLPFVKSTIRQEFNNFITNRKNHQKWNIELAISEETPFADTLYGATWPQTQMLNLISLHQNGNLGQEMRIGIFDSGFAGADTLEVFQPSFANGRVEATIDIVDGGKIKFDKHSHGTHVWSTMAGNSAYRFVGTAPEAIYSLFRTEDVNSEYIIEEFNWVAAAEIADSMGIDIINTSLGYTQFDDPNMNHVYSDLDGNRTPAAIGADIAASKGMLLVVSAGNNGAESWVYISTPADADSVLTVGAVNSQGVYAPFSSLGYAADGDIKPNVMALGQGAAVWTYGNQPATTNGTSFSGPIMAGAVACLWQNNRDKTNMEIIAAVEQSASFYNEPNQRYGYGIPDFALAQEILTQNRTKTSSQNWHIYPNPSSESPLQIRFTGKGNETVEIVVHSTNGHLLYHQTVPTQFREFTVAPSVNWPAGSYLVELKSKEEKHQFTWIKVDK